MKRLITNFLIATLMLTVVAAAFAQKGTGQKQGGASTQQSTINLLKEDLSDEEITSLLQMREEEKLARDVYLALYDQWGTPVFSNIASSEQQHTDQVKELLDKYELDDPYVDESGEFTSEDLAALYASLVKQGSGSLVDALTVGMTIEDLDIYDLEEALNGVDNEDIRTVYENLMKGSRNHLRSFYSELSAQNGTYEPQYISSEEYETILASEMESGSGDRENSSVDSGRGGNGRSVKTDSGNDTCTNCTTIKAGNYPNPANPSTMITYTLSSAAPITITIYNAIGQKVRFYNLGNQEAGEHLQHWDAHDLNGRPVTSGLYLYRIQAGNAAVTHRMMLIQ